VGPNKWALPFLLPGDRDSQSASHVWNRQYTVKVKCHSNNIECWSMHPYKWKWNEMKVLKGQNWRRIFRGGGGAGTFKSQSTLHICRNVNAIILISIHNILSGICKYVDCFENNSEPTFHLKTEKCRPMRSPCCLCPHFQLLEATDWFPWNFVWIFCKWITFQWHNF